MLNYIWLGLMIAAVAIGGATGQLKEVTTAAFEACKTAVMTIALPLAGVMALWLGVMRLAEKSGLIHSIAKVLRPVMTRIFPDVPAEHPAMGSMIMNMAANMLGLSNAATPLGLRAMQDLEKLNSRPGTATNAMCTFLALNTSSVQLIPASAVAVLAAAGSVQPTAIIGTALVATLCSTAVGLVSVKSLEKLPFYRLPPVTPADKAEKKKEEEQEPVTVTAPPPDRLAWRARLLLALFGAFFLFLLWRTASANCEILVRTDPVVEEVWYHVDDADETNDDARTKQSNGNGKGFEPFEDANKNGARDGAEKFTDLNGNGAHDASIPLGWAKANAAVIALPDGTERKEWRFRYIDLPDSGVGTVTVRLLEAGSSRDLTLPAAQAGVTELTGTVARSWGPQLYELVAGQGGGIRSHPLKFFFISCVEAISLLAIPFLLSFFPLYAALRRVPVYEEFVEGAKEGFQVSLRIIPFLVAILAAVGMFRSAGGIDMLTRALDPILSRVGFPTELAPLVFMRPLSGSGTMGIFTELVNTLGPDNIITRMAGTIMGSTETTFYVIAVYFGSVAIRRTRHAVPAGLLADLAGVIASIAICRMVFG